MGLQLGVDPSAEQTSHSGSSGSRLMPTVVLESTVTTMVRPTERETQDKAGRTLKSLLAPLITSQMNKHKIGDFFSSSKISSFYVDLVWNESVNIFVMMPIFVLG